MAEAASRLTDPVAVEIARAILAHHAGDAPLEPRAARAVLAAYGVPVPRERVVRDRDEAVDAAMEHVGFPCLLRSDAADDSTALLRDAMAVGVAYDAMAEPAAAVVLEHVPAGDCVTLRLRGAMWLDPPSLAYPGLAEIATRVAELAHDLRDVIAAIDLDPVIVLPDRAVAVGVLIVPQRRGNP